MDFYQSIVAEHLQRDRGCFLNTEFYLVERNPVENTKKKEWFVDIVAIDLRYGRIWLCEVSYAKGLSSLFKRLGEWSSKWGNVCARLKAEACLTDEMQTWPIYVWAFIAPKTDERNNWKAEKDKIEHLQFGGHKARITELDQVAPWAANRWPISWGPKDIEASQLALFEGKRGR